MKIKNQSWLTVLVSVAASTFICESVRGQIDFSGLNQYRGLNNQRPSGWNSQPSGPSPAQRAQQQREAAAYNEDVQGNNAYDNKDWATAEAYYKQALQNSPNDSVIRKNLANTQNHEGLDAYNTGDYAAAANFFQQALANFPATDSQNYQTIHDNLATTQSQIAEAKRVEEQRQQDKIAANNIQQSIQGLAQTLNAAPPSGGLDFNDGKSSTPANTGNGGNGGGLDFIDSNPNVVDLRGANTTTVDPARVKGSSSGDLAFMDSDPTLKLKDAVADKPSDQKVAGDYLGGRKANPGELTTAPAPTMGTDTKAGDQLLGAAASGDLTVNYDVGGAKTAGSLKKPTELPIDPSTFSDAEKSNPKMMDALKQLNTDKVAHFKLDGELQQLTAQMKSAKDSEAMSDLQKKVDQKNVEVQASLVEVTKAEAVVTHVHHTIIVQYGQAPNAPVANQTPANKYSPDHISVPTPQ